MQRLISAPQMKAARGLLGLSQEELAKASKISSSTISNFEKGFVPRQDIILKIRDALEYAGIEFTEGEGVKRRHEEAKLYRGFASNEIFYNDLLRVGTEQGGEIYCIIKSPDTLLRICGITDSDNLKPLEVLSAVIPIKCLVSENISLSFDLPRTEFRLLPEFYGDQSFYFGYGNQYAHIVPEGRTSFIFAVYRIALTAQGYRMNFLSLWNKATRI